MANIALDLDRTAAPLKIRINRRGWAVLVGIPVFALTIVAAFWVTMLTSSAKASDELPLGTQTVAVTVIPGDSLWSLAGEFAPDYEVSAAIEHIVEINNLPSSEIHVGDTLQIPVLAR